MMKEAIPYTEFISVIIPTYNDQQGLDACLKALAVQTWPREQYEIIVIDNGSSIPVRIDTTYNDFVHIVFCDVPGSYAARNVGIANARGDILAFTDADCLPDQNWIQRGVTSLMLENGCSIIGGEVKLFLSQHPTAVERYQYLTGFMQQENIERLGFSITANLFVTREQVKQIGPFNEKLLSGGDREWSWRAVHAGFSVRYAADAVVHTSPRTSLCAAIRQARRVAGGRLALKRLGLLYVTSVGLRPHRSTRNAARWILTHPELSPWERVQVFAVASVLKIVQVIETTRLRAGTSPERR